MMNMGVTMAMQIILFIAMISTGLMTGIFFTWSNAVTPGIGKLDDKGYLSSLQAMNRVILNPLFYVAFFSPVITILMSIFIAYNSANIVIFQLLVLSSLLYFCGVILVTIMGNIPINNALHRFNIVTASSNNSFQFRDKIEHKWNRFNLIRSVTSFISFVVLSFCCFLLQGT